MLGSTFLVESGQDSAQIDADLRGITPRYFEVMGTPLLRGRAFGSQDVASGPQVAIIDESLARRLRPDGNAVGSRIRWFRQPTVELEIVGIVRSVRHRGPTDPARETVYRPHQQYARSAMFLAVKTDRHATSADAMLRTVVASVDPSQPLADVTTMDQRVGRSVSRSRTSLMLAGALAVMALALGGIGLYGVLSFGVAQRAREFGVRLALGASPAVLRGLVWREGLTLTGLGAILGTIGAAVVARAVHATLYGTSAIDLGPYTWGLLCVLVSSALALWLPARRASRADPAAVLRAD
jgi:ABC-type antimicrobial peptide transport system permease subunit